MSLLSYVYHVSRISDYLYNNFALNGSSNDNFVMDIDEEDDDMNFIIINYIIEHKREFIKKKNSCRTSMLQGRAYILEVLVENLTRCYENFHMRPHVFRNLYDQLKMISFIMIPRT